jgi:hypothetical protein
MNIRDLDNAPASGLMIVLTAERKIASIRKYSAAAAAATGLKIRDTCRGALRR